MREIVVARKDYRCAHCGYSIRVGSEHVYERRPPWRHPMTDVFWTYRAHAFCAKVGDFYESNYPDDVILEPEDFEEWHHKFLAAHPEEDPLLKYR